jgi:uncharacterized RDD family membrane protein YckC
VAEPTEPDLRSALAVVADETAAHVRRRLPFLKTVAAAPGYASFRRRAAAYLVDGALLIAVVALAGVLSFIETTWVAAALATATNLLPFGYLTLSHYGTGQTIGKRLARIRVIDEVYARLSLRQAALRAAVALGGPLAAGAAIIGLSHVALAVTSAAIAVAGQAWAAVDCLAALTDPGRRTFHDRLAGTVVVELRKAGARPPPG